MNTRRETPIIPDISIVIPAYNEEKYLPACLSAVSQQEGAPPYEVIVVDNASTDGTACIAQQCGARVVTEPRKGVARARQAGFEAACGEIIASTDADTRVTPQWLARITGHFREDPALGGVYGPVHWYDGRPAEQLALRHPAAWALWISNRIRHDLWWGSNFAVRCEVFGGPVGFLWIGLRRKMAEDTDLSLRVSRIARVRFDPDLVVHASSRRAEEGWMKIARKETIHAVERFVLGRRPSLPMIDLR